LKTDFLKSEYPMLKNLGEMSAEENVEINFTNMSGTKIYKVKTDSQIPVEIISKGRSISNRDDEKKEMNEIVHSEFAYRNGKIIISSTHWCNLTSVNTEMNVEEVRSKIVMQCGIADAIEFDNEMEKAIKSGKKEEVKKSVTKSVKYLFSGQKD